MCLAGNIPIWALGRHLETNRLFPIWNLEFFYSYTEEDVFSVIRSHTIDVTPHFYKIAALDCSHLNRLEAGYLGKTSCTSRQTMHDKTSGQLMLTNDRQFVFVDAKTRKPVPVPASIAKHYKSSGRQLYIDVQAAPADCFSVTRRAQYSDYDVRYHVSSFYFARWCLDAAAEAVHSRRLRHFPEDMAEYRLRRLELFHMSEVFVRETVSIKVWECSNSEDTLLFRVDKPAADGTVEDVAFCRMTFYPLSFGWDSKL